jgi:hypothetical protein
MVAEKVGQEMDWYVEDTATSVAPTPIITPNQQPGLLS